MTDSPNPWTDIGHPDPSHDETCPTCGRASTVEHNTSAAGGSVCTHCWTVFTHTPGEHAHPKNTHRRKLWRDNYEKGPR